MRNIAMQRAVQLHLYYFQPVFVDYGKAFDKINGALFWNAINIYEVIPLHRTIYIEIHENKAAKESRKIWPCDEDAVLHNLHKRSHFREFKFHLQF